jgi:hypothetical protein
MTQSNQSSTCHLPLLCIDNSINISIAFEIDFINTYRTCIFASQIKQVTAKEEKKSNKGKTLQKPPPLLRATIMTEQRRHAYDHDARHESRRGDERRYSIPSRQQPEGVAATAPSRRRRLAASRSAFEFEAEGIKVRGNGNRVPESGSDGFSL